MVLVPGNHDYVTGMMDTAPGEKNASPKHELITGVVTPEPNNDSITQC